MLSGKLGNRGTVMGRRKEGPPSTLRRGHGPKEALSSGLTRFSTQTRAASSINRDVKEQKLIREIGKWSQRYPELRARFEEITTEYSGHPKAYQIIHDLIWQ